MRRLAARPGRFAVFLLGGLALTLALAFAASPFASSKPDGLEKVAADKGFDRGATSSAFASGPLADYSVKGVSNGRLSTGLSGIAGVTVTFALGGGVFYATRRRHPPTTAAARRRATAAPS